MYPLTRSTSRNRFWRNGTSAWTPAALGPALAMWLDAADASTITLNGSTVSQWNDKSGNARHASQATAANQPTRTLNGLGGRTVITFDGADWLFNANPGALLRNVPGATIAAVVNYTNLSVERIPVTAQTPSPNVRGALRALTTGLDSFFRRLDTQPSGTGTTPVVAYTNGTSIIQIGRADYTAGTTATFVDGTAGGTGTLPDTGNTSNTDSATLVVGGTSTDDGVTVLVPMLGFVGEIIITNTALSTADRQLLEGYLAWKWSGLLSRPWTPADLGSDLVVWFDANDASTITLNGATVSQWSDKSINLRNITQATTANQPTFLATGLNSKPAISFDGTNDRLLGSIPGLANQQNIGFFSVSQTTVRKNAVLLGSGGFGGTASIRWGLFGQGSNTIDGLGWAGPNSSVTLGNGSPIPVGTPMQSSYIKTPSQWEILLDGTSIATVADTSFPTGTFNLIVGSESNSGYFANAVASEIIITRNALSSTNRQRIEGYLAHKWWGSGASNTLPAGHPFKSNPPQI